MVFDLSQKVDFETNCETQFFHNPAEMFTFLSTATVFRISVPGSSKTGRQARLWVTVGRQIPSESSLRK